MKFMLQMNVKKGPYQMEGWSGEDIKRMVEFMHKINAELKAAGQLVSAEGLVSPEEARIVKAKHAHAAFRLVGWIDDHPTAIEEADLRSWVEEGVVEYLGRLEDVRPAISAASVYVLPSHQEGTPHTVLEAMAMGRPIVTTDAPGCRETVRPGQNGYLVPVRDAAALAKALERFIVELSAVVDSDPGSPRSGPANARNVFSASWRYESSPVFFHSRTRFRAAWLLPDGCAPSYWSFARANSFSWSWAV